MADPEIEELLAGLDGPARAEREELIEWLLDQGITAEEVGNSVSPMLLASRRLIGDDGSRVSARQIATSAGIDLVLLQRLLRAIGLPWVDDPDAQVYLPADGRIADHLVGFVNAGIDPGSALQTSRVLAEGLAQAADLMRSSVLTAILEPGATELHVARRSRQLVERLAPLLGLFVEDMLLVQLRHQLDVDAVSAAERAKGTPVPGARQITAAFADLVDFTRLGEMVPPEELVQLTERLAVLGREIVSAPVRFVKTIGDAVMFVSPEPAPLVDAMLRLVEAAGADENLLRLRAGVASGQAVSRVGDWFGSPVNTASRITALARPGTVLVAESVRAALGESEDFVFSFAGARHLKGIKGEIGLFRVRTGVDTAGAGGDGGPEGLEG